MVQPELQQTYINNLNILIEWILFSVALQRVLRKLGASKTWMAYIPGLRYLVLSERLDMAKDGVVCAVLDALNVLAVIVNLTAAFNMSSRAALALVLVELVVAVAVYVYRIRFFLALIRIFGLRKRWIILWLIAEWLALMIISFNKKYQPVAAGGLREDWEAGTAPAEIPGTRSPGGRVMSNTGLSVDLRERTVKELFEKRYLLKDISLDIPNGSLVLLLGGSGAGKTTFVNALIGYEKADATVLLNGVDVYRDYDRMKYRIGFVPQQNLIRGNDTVIHTVADAALLRLPAQLPAGERNRRVGEVMDLLGLQAGADGLVCTHLHRHGARLRSGALRPGRAGLRPRRGHRPRDLHQAQGHRGRGQDRHRHHPYARPRHRPLRQGHRAGEGLRPRRPPHLLRQSAGGPGLLRKGHDGGRRHERQPEGRGRRRPRRRVYRALCPHEGREGRRCPGVNESLKHKGRVGQTFIYLGKLLRMFVYQNDWKVLPMGAVIASVVTFVVGANLFVTQEGTLMGAFALVCVCIWNGFFNSIQVVCRERGIVKREHRSGLHVSSYILAQMIYQFMLCLAQTVITLMICRLTGVKFPQQGVLFGAGVADVGVTLLLITFSADMMALMVSCIVRSTTTAMTVMPFLLIFQLVFSGGFFQLEGFAKKLTVLTISRWGLDSLCAVGRYNELRMVTLWNTIFKFKDIEFEGTKPLLDIILKIQEEGKVDDILYWSGTYNTRDAFVSTAENVLKNWGAIALLTFVFIVVAVIALKLIDRDKR